VAPEHRQFDFWLGEWRVVDSAGNEAGRNRITSLLGGCVISESWEGSDGSKGQSVNIYDRWAKQWHQTWTDDRGLLLQLDGGIVDGKMILEGRRVSPAGTQMLHRITYTPLAAGRVRQHWERSPDGGKTWATQFDGTYLSSVR
jgi:hypothetical protein